MAVSNSFPHDCRLRRLLYAGLALLLVMQPAEADAAPEPQGPSYALSVWTAETGLPSGDILTTTQDLDGYLWLGTTTGLVRFDGSQFVSWGSRGEDPLPGTSVVALAPARDGGLWIGFNAPGGVARIAGGRVVSYANQPDAPANGVAALLADRLGRIWSGSRAGLHAYLKDRWTTVGAAQGFTGGEVYSLYEDRSGALWVGAGGGVYRGVNSTFTLVDGTSTNVQNFTEDDSDAIWVTDTLHIAKRLDRPSGPRRDPGIRLPASGWRLLRDRRGSIWVAALGGGLLHVTAPQSAGRIERFAYEHKIAGAPRSLFEDRDGNIWVGIRGGGLLRLSDSALHNVALEGLTNDGVRAAASSPDGSVWIATGYNLNRFIDGRREVYDLAQTLALYSDRVGTMWASTTTGLGRFVNGRFVPPASSGGVRWGRVISVTFDDRDLLWICSSSEGVMSWDRQPSTQAMPVAELAGRPCSAVYSDRQGRIWVGFIGGDVAVIDSGMVRMLGKREGLATGRVMAILEDKAGAIWISAFNGLSRYQDGRFETLTQQNGPIDAVVPTLVEDLDGYLWVGVQRGAAVLRFHPREMDKVAANRAYSVEYALYDSIDGMQGPLHWQSGATGVRGGDGRLWFATGLGLSSVDPRKLPRTRGASTPRIELAAADAKRVATAQDLELPSGTSNLRLDYTAISLSDASKLRFRYSMAGPLDDRWVVAGASRVATYSNLKPGKYRFRVSATTDGQWTEAALWDFTIAPPFYMARGFYALIALFVVSGIGAAWWLRLRAVQRRYGLVFAERARVSREIHDTLLQNLGAIGLELEAIALQLNPVNQPARDGLRRLRKQVGHSLREARESIWELRHSTLDTEGLVDSLQTLADTTTRTKGVPATLTVTGRPDRNAPEVDMQLFRIAQEAVNNAVRHGQASEIQITLAYDGQRASLSVSDNGCGFVVEEHDTGPAAGEHLGLLSMRERAARIRGRFTIWSNPGHGTTIEAVGPPLAK